MDKPVTQADVDRQLWLADFRTAVEAVHEQVKLLSKPEKASGNLGPQWFSVVTLLSSAELALYVVNQLITPYPRGLQGAPTEWTS